MAHTKFSKCKLRFLFCKYRMFIKYCVFFENFKIYSGLWPLLVFQRCVNGPLNGRTPALQQNWQSSENSQHFKEKTQYLMNTLYYPQLERLSVLTCQSSQRSSPHLRIRNSLSHRHSLLLNLPGKRLFKIRSVSISKHFPH